MSLIGGRSLAVILDIIMHGAVGSDQELGLITIGILDIALIINEKEKFKYKKVNSHFFGEILLKEF